MIRGNEKVCNKPIRCYDNGGRSMDRYIVVYMFDRQTFHGDKTYSSISMNAEPRHPQGFGQHGAAMLGPHLGKRILFKNLPAECQIVVRQDCGLTLDGAGCLEPKDLPKECILDCSHSGACDEDVKRWRIELNFTVERSERNIKALQGYGAWSREELEAKSDDALAELVLWIACGDFRDGQKLFCLE